MYAFGNSDEILRKCWENFKKDDSDYIYYSRYAVIMFCTSLTSYFIHTMKRWFHMIEG